MTIFRVSAVALRYSRAYSSRVNLSKPDEVLMQVSIELAKWVLVKVPMEMLMENCGDLHSSASVGDLTSPRDIPYHDFD